VNCVPRRFKRTLKHKQFSQPATEEGIGRLSNNRRQCCAEFLVHCNTHCYSRSHDTWRLIEGFKASLCAFGIAL
jgi:hypothetical protein